MITSRLQKKPPMNPGEKHLYCRVSYGEYLFVLLVLQLKVKPLRSRNNNNNDDNNNNNNNNNIIII
jgi:hypothetical protein